jgi:hypothetical protein
VIEGNREDLDTIGLLLGENAGQRRIHGQLPQLLLDQ